MQTANASDLSRLAVPDLRGRVALVTGASTGIGAAVARTFGAQGMKVAVHYNQSEGPAGEVANDIRRAGGEALLIKADVRDSTAIRSRSARCCRLLAALTSWSTTPAGW